MKKLNNEDVNFQKQKFVFKDAVLRNKKFVTVISILLVVLLTATVVVAVILLNREPDTYSFVMSAIDSTESKSNMTVQINSLGQIKSGGVTQQTDTDGIITFVEEDDIVHFYLNTKSSTIGAEAEDFDVTVSLFCEDDVVYDNTTGANVVVEDMTADEFREIVDGYSLYRYSKDKAVSASFVENEMEGYENCGDVTVQLSAPEDEVLESFSQKLSEVTGEKVKANQLEVNSASVTYSIYNEMVAMQKYSFTVTYTASSGQDVMYTSVSEIAFMENSDEEYDEFVPVETSIITEED